MTEAIDQALAELAAKKEAWAQVSLPRRIQYLEDMRRASLRHDR